MFLHVLCLSLHYITESLDLVEIPDTHTHTHRQEASEGTASLLCGQQGCKRAPSHLACSFRAGLCPLRLGLPENRTVSFQTWALWCTPTQIPIVGSPGKGHLQRSTSQALALLWMRREDHLIHFPPTLSIDKVHRLMSPSQEKLASQRLGDPLVPLLRTACLSKPLIHLLSSWGLVDFPSHMRYSCRRGTTDTIETLTAWAGGFVAQNSCSPLRSSVAGFV